MKDPRETFANTYTVLAIPHLGTVRGETTRSLSLLCSHSAWHGVRHGYCDVESSNIAASRHQLVKKALQDPKATHILFIDADMTFPMNSLLRLLQHDVDVVAANCTTRVEPIMPVAIGFDEKRVDSRNRKGLQEVRQVGCAFMLMKLAIFKKLKPPFFLQDWIPSLNAYCGEDVFMCQVIQKEQVKVWIDHDLSREIMHVGTKAWGHQHITLKVEDVA